MNEKNKRKATNCSICKNIPDHQHEASGSPYAIFDTNKLKKLGNNLYLCQICKQHYYYEESEYGESLSRINDKYMKELMKVPIKTPRIKRQIKICQEILKSG